MKIIPKAHEIISNMKSFFQPAATRRSYQNEEPLRAELFSSEQMARFGKTLAKNHVLSNKPAEDHLLKRLADNEEILRMVHKLLTDAIKRKYQISPAGEWLMDNFYLVEENIRNAKIHFPKDYSEDLPQLATSSNLRLTRIYDLVLKIISHSDGRIDIENLSGFLKAYQSVSNLQLGELWAIPIMLRLALIENLRRVSSRIAIDRIDSNLADYWAKKMIETADNNPKDLILVIADMARSNPPMVSAFVSELTRQLRGKGPDLALSLNWIEQQLSDSGLTSAELINTEIQKQAADQVSMSNSIGSLRLLGAMDWRDFVEAHSIVEHTLREDPAKTYSLMDFSTRDRYRHAVEGIAKKSRKTEYEIASIALELARQHAQKHTADQREAHIGYYLIDEGISQTKKNANLKEQGLQKLQKFLSQKTLFTYLFFVSFLTCTISIAILMRAYVDTKNSGLLTAMAALALICASQLAISVVNFFSTLWVKPHLLPRMNFSTHIPEEFRTLVVVPSMLSTAAEIESLIEALEVRFLANRNEGLHFGLLTDYMDASMEHLPWDQALLDLAREKTEALNKKYNRRDLFFLFHRPRKWNEKEKAWMGYERKRGKLADLNALLKGQSKDDFCLIIGDQNVLPKIRYVITLDADTQLPLGAAWKMVGTMAHPLNQAWYDPQKKRVTKGYGILQPRVSVSLPDSTSSLYTRMHGNEAGIDPYTRASSDVYQDLFHEGSFIGKGIYDVDIFTTTLEGRFADNSILSHDLLEGCYVRSGLLSDVQLFEKYPATYRADMKRRARWIRGDWQIFSWFTPVVPDKNRKWQRNPLSGLSKWKIFDNIRRSLVPLALTILLILGWTVLPSSLLWTLFVSAIIIIPIFVTSVWYAINKPRDVVFLHHVKNSVYSVFDISVKTLFTLICLPFEAFLNLASIIRAATRMLITRKKLLEWNPSANEERISQSGLIVSYFSMLAEPILALLMCAFLFFHFPDKLSIAAPILFLWFVAPLVTWLISRPVAKQVTTLNHTQTIFLRKLARKTWGFFEQFVTAQDSWLPPDNYQEQPAEQLAHRTSPTNIGLYLLSCIAARDFGYITTGMLIERIKNTIRTMEKMERFKGHFYNWYDTETLQPLLPKYISTVDSGNLVGHLLIARQGLLAIAHRTTESGVLFEGLLDTLYVFEDTLSEKEKEIVGPLKKQLETICSIPILNSLEARSHIESIHKNFELACEKIIADLHADKWWWKENLKQQLRQMMADFHIYEPWALLKSAPAVFGYLAAVPVDASYSTLLISIKELQAQIEVPTTINYSPEEAAWLHSFEQAVSESIRLISEQLSALENLANSCNQLSEIDWSLLYDKASNLFTIGYNVQDHRMDNSFYDLLASEARVSVFLGIAQGKLPEESWFALGRLLTNVNGDPILLSWSGSMFEYLMPLLIMPTYDNTLLDETYKAAVKWQIEYGKQTGMPWGISESGYNMVNANSNYQYRAFGAPGLGLKRGLEEDAVIAPYATALALMVAPEKACENLEQLSQKGFEGRYGLYEAIDYTPSRVQRGQSGAIIYSFMAHHQGMSLLSMAYLLLDKPMQKLFEAEPQFKATLLLLQEKVPRATTFYAHTTDIADINYVNAGAETRVIHTPNTAIPEVQLLSNGNYHVMVTNAGSGYSRWKGLAVTRWREDVTCDNRGTFCYIRDVEKDVYWSNTFQPALQKPEKYEAAFSQGRVDFRSINNEIETHTEVVVSPEDDIEMRRSIITNLSNVPRTIEITSYAEVVIAPADSDLFQPAFSSLFVQTEIIPDHHAILCTRRPRSKNENPPYMFHIMAVQGKQAAEVSYETDRMEFIGRGNNASNPKAMSKPGPLSGKQGSVLDPVVAIRYRIVLEPEETIVVDMIIGIAGTKEDSKGLIEKYQDKQHKDRVFELAWTHSQVVLRQINASETDAQLYGHLASSILFTNSAFRAEPAILINNHRGQSGLWGYSISGDLPIVLAKIERQDNIQLIKQLIQAHAYWRLKGIAVDLVIWNEDHGGYRQVFQNEIQSLIPAELVDKPGGIFVRASDQIPNEDRILFETVARINISDNGGTLADFIKRKPMGKASIPYIKPSAQPSLSPSVALPIPENSLFYNGLGGFSATGDEYIITTDSANRTPAPWSNVLANPDFGSVVSESGTAYTWMENAHEFRLTPWNNDPVSDSGGEAFYLRDEESGRFWSASLLPAGSSEPYLVRHGFGYSIFEHLEDGIHSCMCMHVDLECSVKFISIKISNRSGRARKLSATGYVEWVLGNNKSKTSMYIHTEVDPNTGALLAKNPYSTEFAKRVSFFDVDYIKKSYTSDRTEFIGRNRNLQSPDGMTRVKLSGKTGLALDPCAAIQIPFELAPDEEHEIIFRLGAGKDIHEAIATIQKFRGHVAAQDSLNAVKKYWKHTVGAMQVETPDTAINLITNGWVTYQTLSARLWGRSGYYQSGGAFGFRDQLQDVMSLLHSKPVLAREQLLLCASRQFREGDVQHWWHPPVGRGVRTRCSDDFLWLPLVTSVYISHTGDLAILKETAPFLEGRQLNEGEESYYDLPTVSARSATLYEHCVQAIKHGFQYGERGLPLMGTGDWNDGFDKVGEHGKGESVWLAFFFYDILNRFAEVANTFADASFADQCKQEAQKLKDNIEKSAWDGAWYKRAWFDDGTPLGSEKNEECKIDSIAQSWSVLSGAGSEERTRAAMDSAYKHLVQKDSQIIQLLEPPFDASALNPGYIKGYVPGVRENGGQYTHAAVWLIMAFAKLGDNKKVWELLNLINPVNHGKTADGIARYKVEPYVLAADVYARQPHEGRGGWTWYTGSAGWMYRLITESFLGIRVENDRLTIAPCIPEEWESFKVNYRYRKTMYRILVTQQGGNGNSQWLLDGKEVKDTALTLVDDRIEHSVEIRI